MASSIDNDIPQWKKDLIARLRNQNKRTATVAARQQQLYADPPQSTSAALGRVVQQPSSTCPSNSVTSGNLRVSVVERCNVLRATCSSNQQKMVQERVWVDNKHDDFEMVSDTYKNGDCKNSDSDSSEDLHYGPGIVNKLKNKYLSLALRENSSRNRASILPMRKAASLENILDDATPNGAAPGGGRLFQSRMNGNNDTGKNVVPNRYRNAARGSDMKRARSVETISRADSDISLISSIEAKPKRESLHEEMLIYDKDGNDKLCRKTADNKMLEITTETKTYNSINIAHRINRPKRIIPIMNEKEKPPVDVVKQAKLIFERRPEQRTRAPHATGEVAAKVATYKSIIVQAKTAKKPPIKHKPVGLTISDKLKTNNGNVRLTKTKIPHNDNENSNFNNHHQTKDIESEKILWKTNVPNPLSSPIPDISRIDFPQAENERGSKNSSLCETPDLILTSSPIQTVSSPTFKISATENFIKEEIRHSYSPVKIENNKISNPNLSPIYVKPSTPNFEEYKKDQNIEFRIPPPPQIVSNNGNAPNSITFNFAKTTNNSNSEEYVPPSQPLKLEIDGSIINLEPKKLPSPKIFQQTQTNEISKATNNQNIGVSNLKPVLTTLEIEKNFINTTKTLEQPSKSNSVQVKCLEEVIKIQVPKVKRPPREPESNSIVFKFTDRKDVPDYVHNDKTRSVAKVEKPKVGEGGIILLPGASIDESFTDEDDEILRSLEGPPSPCDVTFINDNILIDGKSSLSQKTKKLKMRISFMEAGPEIYEYPSESSLLLDDVPAAPVNAQMGHTVPSLSGSSSLANYTPKSTEDFQPGITRSIQNIPTKTPNKDELLLQEVEQPILFSAGTNSDILF